MLFLSLPTVPPKLRIENLYWICLSMCYPSPSPVCFLCNKIAPPMLIYFSESSPLCEALKLSGLRKEFGSRSFLFCPENAFLWRYENLSQPIARLRQQLEKVQNSVPDISQKMTILSNQIAGALGQRNPNVTYESFEFDKNRTEFRRILEQVSGTIWWQS